MFFMHCCHTLCEKTNKKISHHALMICNPLRISAKTNEWAEFHLS
jgi:hypothetical protein